MNSRLFLVSCLAASSAFPGVVSAARLVTFRYEAVRELEASEAFFPVPRGTRVTGTYTFDLDTPAGNVPAPTTFTRYPNAINNFNVRMECFGEGDGFGGEILIGAPVLTSGGFNFLSDQYQARASLSGISLATRVLGTRNLIGAIIWLRDLDQEGIDTEDLLPSPPDLKFFLDHTGPNFDSDNAELLLTFDTESFGANSNAFRLLSLTVVPEPSTGLLVSFAAWLVCVIGERRPGAKVGRDKSGVTWGC